MYHRGKRYSQSVKKKQKKYIILSVIDDDDRSVQDDDKVESNFSGCAFDSIVAV
jgi:hypothetical protein